MRRTTEMWYLVLNLSKNSLEPPMASQSVDEGERERERERRREGGREGEREKGREGGNG